MHMDKTETSALLPYQTVNWFPAMPEITIKDLLHRNLYKMQQKYGEEVSSTVYTSNVLEFQVLAKRFRPPNKMGGIQERVFWRKWRGEAHSLYYQALYVETRDRPFLINKREMPVALESGASRTFLNLIQKKAGSGSPSKDP